MDGQVTLRPVTEDDLPWLAFLNDPATMGPYEWHGWSDPQRLRRSRAESGLLDDNSGVLDAVIYSVLRDEVELEDSASEDGTV